MVLEDGVSQPVSEVAPVPAAARLSNPTGLCTILRSSEDSVE